MSAAASSSSVVLLDDVADTERDTAASPYFASEGAAFSWPAAERTMSTLSAWSALRRLCDDHGVPKEYEPYFANDKPACTPLPEGSGAICVYADALDAGMRVPLHGFHAELLRHYGLAPAQLAPNAWRYVAAFVLLCSDAGVQPMVPVFQHFFSVCTHKGDNDGWHHFKPSHYAGSRRRRVLFVGKMSKTMYSGWKSRFFFLQAPPGAPWPCPVKWGKPTRVAVHKPGLTSTASAAVEKLLDMVGDSGIDVAQFLSRRSPPVGPRVHLTPPDLAVVKKEPGTTEQTRKRKSAEPVTACGDAETSTPMASARRASGGERSTTPPLYARLAQMVEAELHEKEQELQARDSEVARLEKELQAARDAHAAEVKQLRDDLQKANAAHSAEASRLAEELLKVQAERAAEVEAVKAQHQTELIGLSQMRQLALAMYRRVADLSELKLELLRDGGKDGELGLPPQPPAMDQ